MKKLIVLLGLLVAFSASAKDCEKEAYDGGMAAVRDCIASQNEDQVNKAYQQLLLAHKGSDAAIQAAKEAQDSWGKFRFSTCEYIGETVNKDEQAGCIDDFNKARVKMLNQYAKQAKENKSK